MKMRWKVLAVIAVLGFSAAAWAKNTVDVTGDLGKDGYLTIEVDWVVDTAKYRGLDGQMIRDKVREEMWEKVLPQLVKKTSGYPVSYEKSAFTKVKETDNLIERRSDGSEVHDVDVVVRFYCPRYSGAPQKISTSEHKQKMDEEFRYQYVRGTW